MPRAITTIVRVMAGIVGLFAGWLLGGYVAANSFPQAELVNKMETLPTKLGSSFGVLIATILLRRFVLRSLRLTVVSLVATEVVVFMIIVQVTGLLPFSLFHLHFNFGWLYGLTWNVIIACLLGVLVGHCWDR